MARFLMALMLVVLCGSGVVAQSQLQPPTDNFDITGDFGPRNLDPFFHFGIDYGGNPGAPVRSVETGQIVKIAYDSNSGHHVVIKGANRFGYLHLFSDSTLGTASSMGDCQSVTGPEVPFGFPRSIVCLTASTISLEDRLPVTLHQGVFLSDSKWKACSWIVHWADSQRINAQQGRAFSNCNGIPVGANKVKTTRTVLEGVNFAPLGNSGFKDKHLHLQVGLAGSANSYNPLHHVLHNPSDFKVSLNLRPTLRPDGSLIIGRDISPLEIVLTVTSSPGLNLNRVVIRIYKETTPEPICKDQDETATNHICKVFDYGGLPPVNGRTPGHARTANVLTPPDPNSSVIPGGNEPGIDRFFYDFDWQRIAKSAPGRYVINAKAYNIYGQIRGQVSNSVVTIGEDNSCSAESATHFFDALYSKDITLQAGRTYSLAEIMCFRAPVLPAGGLQLLYYGGLVALNPDQLKQGVNISPGHVYQPGETAPGFVGWKVQNYVATGTCAQKLQDPNYSCNDLPWGSVTLTIPQSYSFSSLTFFNNYGGQYTYKCPPNPGVEPPPFCWSGGFTGGTSFKWNVIR